MIQIHDFANDRMAEAVVARTVGHQNAGANRTIEYAQHRFRRKTRHPFEHRPSHWIPSTAAAVSIERGASLERA